MPMIGWLGDSRLWVAGIFVMMLVALVAYKKPPSVVFGAAVLACYGLNLLEISELLGYLSNPALVTLMLLLMVSNVLEKTVLIDRFASGLLVSSYSSSLARLSGVSLFCSALLNNTAVVATLLNRVASNHHHSPSRLLIPLSYCAILGGTVTLVGTSTNLIVNSFVIDAGLPPLQLFDFAWVGLPVALICGFSVWLLSSSLLPDRAVQLTRRRDFLVEARVIPGSELEGRSVEANGLRTLDRLFLAEIQRGDELISPVRPSTLILADDRLLFSGEIGDVSQIEQFSGLVLNDHGVGIPRTNLIEAVLSHTSSLVGHTVKHVGFRGRFDAAVLAVCRGSHKLSGRIGDIELKAGDCLILATGQDFEKRHPEAHMHLIQGDIQLPALKEKQSLAAIGGFLACLLGSAAGIFALMDGLVCLLAAFLALGWVSPSEIRFRFPLGLFVTVGCALAFAGVWVSTGLVDSAISWIYPRINGEGPYFALLVVYCLTVLLTELVTNNVAVALAFPVAYSSAQYFGVEPMAFIMASAFGASASFITPLGYQTNLMVYSAGQYQFTDFIKLGLPISLIYAVVALTLIPIFFPFVA